VPTVRELYLRALARYRAQPLVGVPATLYRATEGDGADLPVASVVQDPLFGWGELFGDELEVVDIEGGHSTMLHEGRVDAIANSLRRAFDKARAHEDSQPANGAPAAPRVVKSNGASAKATPRTAVTVVVVSYKTAKLVTRLLASLARERERASSAIELRAIIVDNSSVDAPPLREAIAQHRWQPWVTLIEAERNGGFAYGNNLGFAHAYASGHVPDYFFLLNPDTEVRANALEPLVRFMRDNPTCGVAGSSLETEDGTPWPYAFRFPSLLSEIEGALGFSLATRVLSKAVVARQMSDRAEPVDWLPGASFMVRREVIDQLGGMDESYFLYYEETDFCRKVKAAGWGVWYVPESRVMHIAGQSTGVTTPREKARRLPDYWFESRRRYFSKQHGIPYAIATDAVTLVAYAMGRSKLVLQGRNARVVPRYLFDLARHSPLRARNRAISPAREFHHTQIEQAPRKAAAL
jgi:GT2 family glycosyltransferase